MKAAGLPTLSSKERVALDLLLGGSRYGLQLVADSRGALKRGTVYVTLGRMEQKGLVESRHEPAAGESDAIPRRMYHITAYGRRVMTAWTTVARALALEPGT
jgi:DNA-binding PadR family transcriptional regulator